jgi:RimJ/RimL family protein N-acetyltransferase
MTYEVLPLMLAPERAEIISTLLRRVASHDTIFARTDCEARCIPNELTLPEMCEACRARMRTIAGVLSDARTRAWEVWNADAELVGVMYLSEILPGVDAKGHYVFWDRAGLKSKTAALREVISWAFEDHEGWPGLSRITIEIPAPFAALVRHASKALGFGGPFKHALRERDVVRVEGVKRRAVEWRGELVDLLILGLQRTPT